MPDFFLLPRARTGSTLLLRSLNQHPQIECCGEVMAPSYREQALPTGSGPERLKAFYQRPRTKERRGCSIHVENMGPGGRWTPNGPQGPWESGWTWLQSQKDFGVIATFRTDVLAQLASHTIASSLQKWQEQPQENRPVYRIEPARLLQFHEETVWRWIYRLRMFPQHQLLLVEYEAMAEAWDNTIDKIQHWLQVSRVSLPPAMTKQENRPLEEVLSNYGELRRIADGLPKIAEVAQDYLQPSRHCIIRKAQ